MGSDAEFDKSWNDLSPALSQAFQRDGCMTSKEYIELYTGVYDLGMTKGICRLYHEFRVLFPIVQNAVLQMLLAAEPDLRALEQFWTRSRIMSHIFDVLDRCRPHRSLQDSGRLDMYARVSKVDGTWHVASTMQVAREAFVDVCTHEVNLAVAREMCLRPAQSEVVQRTKEIYRSMGIDLRESICAVFRDRFEKHGLPIEIIDLIFSRVDAVDGAGTPRPTALRTLP